MRLHQYSPRGPVIIVAHGGLIWKLRQRIEGWSVAEYHRRTTDPDQFLENCGLVEYISNKGDLKVRTGTPHLNTISSWQDIFLPAFTNADLLKNAAAHPPLKDQTN
jgi:broad specificity phosphatase PhoE